jgi:soluble lytic murein transglycosylase
MMRKIIYCAIFALILFPAASRGDRLDLPELYDLNRGLNAWKSGRPDVAAVLLDGRIGNPFLDGLRAYYRSRALLTDSLHSDALRELERLIALADREECVRISPSYTDAINLYAVTLAGSGSRKIPRPGEFPYLDKLAGGSMIRLSAASLDAGDITTAIEWFELGIEERLHGKDAAALDEAVRGLERELERIGKSTLIAGVKAAARAGDENSADMLTGVLNRRFPGDYEAELQIAEAAARFGEQKRALSMLKNLFDSNAPVAVKRDALIAMAAIEYSLKHTGRASELYRLFGMYYPEDPRSVTALDLAARIEIVRRRYREALRIWETIRKRGIDSHAAAQAALSEATLRLIRGEKSRARGILLELQRASSGSLEPAVLYWLAQTSAPGTEREKWRNHLRRAYPYSLYATVLDGGEDILDREKGSGSRDFDLHDLVSREQSRFDSILADVTLDDSLTNHPAYDAFVYCLESGFLSEAGEIGHVLIALKGADEAYMFTLYRLARDRGLVSLCLDILNTPAMRRTSRSLPFSRFYPLAYPDIIGFQAERRNLHPALLLAVIREESRFDEGAVSRAGAVGLMQLMPSTGVWIGSKIGRRDITEGDLFDPQYNIEAGSWYLHYLVERCGGSVVSALAAYNAGAKKTSKWRKTFNPSSQPLAAIELIGVKETRDYVRRVLGTMAAYHSIMDECGEL